ncbi:MAG TPA: hypothetical protein VLT51_01205 [Anaerolineales bacterium]|nr:hypothetical protein [Anaerolineales bacterium]
MTADSQEDIQSLKAIGRVTEMRAGWSLCTADNAIAAQFEHTIIVTKNEPIILTL